jgi:hypothetical protein
MRTTKGSLTTVTRIERNGSLIGTVNQGRFASGMPVSANCNRVPLRIHSRVAHVQKHENRRGFGSHKFWHGLRVALNSDGAASAPWRCSHPFSSWDVILANCGYQVVSAPTQSAGLRSPLPVARGAAAPLQTACRRVDRICFAPTQRFTRVSSRWWSVQPEGRWSQCTRTVPR